MLIQLMIVLILIGVYIPRPEAIVKACQIAVAVIVVLWLLSVLGILHVPVVFALAL